MIFFGLNLTTPIHQALRLTMGSLATVGLLGTAAIADIIPVGFDDVDLPTLSESEQETLDTLQSVRLPLILSEVSPDRSTLVVATLDRLSQTDWRVQFLDLNTGELIDSIVLEYEVFSPFLPIQWVDNRTIRFVQGGRIRPVGSGVAQPRHGHCLPHDGVPHRRGVRRNFGSGPRFFALCPAGLRSRRRCDLSGVAAIAQPP
jgi:hypothetical protein